MDLAQHINDVQAVLKCLLKHGLFVKLKKCVFCVKEILFLGFLLIIEKVKMKPNRVSIIAKWPKPTTFKEIQVFFKFANFYKRFIMRFSRIVRRLIDMLKDGTQSKSREVLFTFILKAKISFLNLYTAFTTLPLLKHFDLLLLISMELNVLGFAILAILFYAYLQIRHLHFVVFWSRKKSLIK